MKKIFINLEFTELSMASQFLSIGIVTEDGNEFYAENNYYNKDSISDWVEENVIKNFKFNDSKESREYHEKNHNLYMKNTPAVIADELVNWLNIYRKDDEIEVWSDCLAFDWALFINLFGTAFDLPIPKFIYYIPFDICTLFKVANIDPDISREWFANLRTKDNLLEKHNSLFDAKVIKLCYDKLKRNHFRKMK